MAVAEVRMIGKRPDVLAGLSRKQRREREADDLAFVMRQPMVRTSNPDDIELVKRTTGLDISGIPAAKPDDDMLIVCLRVDLDHPIMLRDNVIGHCADCDCDIQHRPDTPKTVHLCVCCTARRQREQPE